MAGAGFRTILHWGLWLVSGIAPAALSYEAALAGPTELQASEIRALLTGNTLVYSDGPRSYRWFFAEDGTYNFDPGRSFAEQNNWRVSEEDDKFCEWLFDPEKEQCITVSKDGDRVIMHFGGDLLGHSLEPGDTTDPSDNPGEDYGPLQSMTLPADLEIIPPGDEFSADHTGISGAWFGTWGVFRDFVLVVEKFDRERVQIVYSWGPNIFSGGDPGWNRTDGRFDNGELTLTLFKMKVVATLRGDGTLDITAEANTWEGRTRAIRWNDSSLEAPRAAEKLVAPNPSRAREKLTFRELQTGGKLGEAPLHNGYFMPLGETGNAHDDFEGRLTIKTSQMLGRPAGARGHQVHGAFPAFSVDFLTRGDRLVPSERGIIQTSRDGGRWNIILEPGRIWSEPGDDGWSRASFPFLLTGPQYGDGHNGLVTFLFNEKEISHLRFQVVKEASPFAHLDLWGEAEADYDPMQIHGRGAVIDRYQREIMERVEIKPWSELEARFGVETLAPFDGTVIRPEISNSAMIVDGTVYATTCRTRYGAYPYCREMRHGIHSATKTLGALLSLLRLAEKYGDEVFNLRLVDYVEIDALHDGWKHVTFEHAINMVTGIGNVEPTRVTHYVEMASGESANFSNARSAKDKFEALAAFGSYPWGPGEVFRYSGPELFVLGAAMDGFLKSKEGPDAHLWEMMAEEVFQPIGIPKLPLLHSIEEPEMQGLPLLASGMFATLEDIAKIERLLRNRGRHNGVQLLHAEKLRESLEDGFKKGYRTGWMIDQGEVNYYRAFWIAAQKSRAGCTATIPTMSGAGGTYVQLMPNALTTIRFAGGPDENDDSGTYNSEALRQVADAIRPLCEP